jgi:ferredoxin
VAQRVASASAEPASFPVALDQVLREFGAEFEVSESAKAELGTELVRLRDHLPRFGALLGLSASTLPLLYAAAVRRGRRARKGGFAGEVKKLLAGLDDLLRAEAGKEPSASSPDALAASVGGGASLLDPAVLAQSLGVRRGSVAMSAERRDRVEAARTNLSAWLAAAADQPELYIVHDGSLADRVRVPRAEVVERSGALGAAVELFDGLAAHMVGVLRSVRVARLELAGQYDPALHDAVLGRFGWEAFSEDELLLIPPVVVLQPADKIRPSLAALSDLLRSGRPVHVIVPQRASGVADGGDTLGTSHLALGYLAVAHREAFVLQSTLGRPSHLRDGLSRLSSSVRPGLAVVAEPAWTSPVPPALQLEASHEGRATPCFIYDPAGGSSWAGRFSLDENPAIAEDWPIRAAAYLDEDGKPASHAAAFTFVHAAALDPAARPHLRVIPRAAWSDELCDAGEWLAASRDRAPQRVPTIWLVGADGQLARAVVTRELMFAARDRLRFWEVLQELAGIRDEYATRAAADARATALAEAAREREELTARHAEEIERVRGEAAREAMGRLAQVLLDMDLTAVAAAPVGTPAARPAVKAPAADEPAVAAKAPESKAPAKEEDDVSFDEAYIDTMLCTSCNECININPMMFKYNPDKQAFLGDARAGTFEQLVKAAEKCSARCIHPGAPRPDDATATPELIARAKPFNG